jgi:hypothetical protein
LNGGDGGLLDINDDEFDAYFLKFRRESGMVRVVMGCQQVFDVGELNACTFEFMLEFRQRSSEAYIDEQARFGIGEDVVIGGCVADIEDVHERNHTPSLTLPRSNRAGNQYVFYYGRVERKEPPP